MIDLKVLDDFSNAMIGSSKISGESIFFKIKEEPITMGFLEEHNYNLHFHFGLHNDKEEEAVFKIHINSDDGENLSEEFKRIWVSGSNEAGYDMVKINGTMAYPGKFQFPITLKPGEKKFIANYLPMDYQKIQDEMLSRSEEADGIVRCIGRSINGNPINAIEFGDTENKPCLMFLSGYHPPEMDPFLILSIIKHLENNEEYRSTILEKISISFIPYANPDGFEKNMQGSNMSNINMHWKFFGNTKDDCPECHSIWEYASRKKPVFFMDFHMFTFQNFEKRLYPIPSFYLPCKLNREIQDRVNDALSLICYGNKNKNHFIVSEKILAPDLLATRLRKEFGSVTSPKFHLHIKEGRDRCDQQAVDIFTSITGLFMERGDISRDEFLIQPHGSVKVSSPRKMLWSFLDILNFKLLHSWHRLMIKG